MYNEKLQEVNIYINNTICSMKYLNQRTSERKFYESQVTVEKNLVDNFIETSS